MLPAGWTVAQYVAPLPVGCIVAQYVAQLFAHVTQVALEISCGPHLKCALLHHSYCFKICVESKHTSYPANLQWILQTYTSSLCFRAASEGALKGILGYTDEDVVSNDFVGDSR